VQIGDLIAVQFVNDMNGVFSLISCDAGTVVRKLSTDDAICNPTRTSIHIGNGRHVEDPVGIYINHACKPSCKIDGSSVVAINKLDKGDEITFNYSESELTISTPFTCLCCGDTIGGSQ
tara:strand:- start:806 stop:1162 length:357 start_codon:yes stop_codon:yes gene_type:complete